MLRKLKFIILTSLLVGGAVLCAIRWKAWFGNPPEPKWEGDTINLSLKTLADKQISQSLQKDTLEFVILGDVHNGLDSSDYASIYERYPNLDFYVQLGDWMERSYFYYEQMLYQSILRTGFDTLPVIAIPGNHEHTKGIIKHLPDRWKMIFKNPLNGPISFEGSTYLVDFPLLRVIAINTDGLQLLSDYTRVGFWLKKSLREARNKYTIVIMHHPVFSTARGRMNPLIWLNFYGALREADIVFSGHDHNYARRKVEYKERFWTKQQPTIFISTNASKKNYPVKENAIYEASFSGETVYEYLYLTPENLSIRTYKVNSGEMIDEVVVLNK
jgi:predicted phosphodiesterase